MDTSGCMGASCANLKRQDINTAKSCTVKQTAREDYNVCECSLLPPPSFVLGGR
jgi:hypothetical protein